MLAACVILSALPARGKYSDDYAASLIDPASGRAVWPDSPLDLVDHFGRPLHLMLTPVLQTLLWNHDWVYHLLNGIAHLLCVALLASLLRTLGASWAGTSAGIAAFCFFPFHHEVIFWSMSLVIALATALMLASMLVAMRFVRMDPGERMSWALLPLLALLAFIVPCFYEHPSAALGVLPILVLALPAGSAGWRRRLIRTALMCGVAWGATLVYVALKVATAPPLARGSSETLVDPADLPARFLAIHAQAGRWILARIERAFPGAIETGLSMLRDPLTLAGMALAVAGMAMFVRAAIRSSAASKGDTPSRRSLALVVAGAGIVSLALLPYSLVHLASLAARAWYLPAIGGGIALAGLVDLLLASTRNLPIARWIDAGVALLTVMMGLTGALAQIGYGEAMRRQSQADIDQSARLAAMLDRPDPWVVLVPMHSAFRPTHTGADLFDAELIAWHRVVWAIRSLMRFQMQRNDLHAIEWGPWNPAGPLRDVDDDGWSYPGWLPPHPVTPQRLSRVSWSDTIPFTIDADGGIRLVDEIILESPDGRDRRISLDHVRTWSAPGARFRSFAYQTPSSLRPAPGRPVARWRVAHGERPRPDARIGGLKLWQRVYECVRLDLAPKSRAPRAIATRLAPGKNPRELLLRVTVPRQHLQALNDAGVIALRVRLEGERHALGALLLDARTLGRERRWLPLVVSIPALDAPRRLIVELAGERQERAVPVFVSRGRLRTEGPS